MALTDQNDPDPSPGPNVHGLNAPATPFDPASGADAAARRAIPFDAIARLPRLHGEAGHNFRLSRFLERSPQAALLLMLAGAAAMLTQGGSLQADFAWGVAVLIGIVAMIRNFIRGFARTLRRVPLEEAAADLRFLLLYIGTAWGVGAFLVLPGQPAPLLAFAFAALPALGLALMLRDEKGAAAFTVPAALLTAGAALIQAWPSEGWVAAAIIGAGAAISVLPALQHARTRTKLPETVLP